MKFKKLYLCVTLLMLAIIFSNSDYLDFTFDSNVNQEVRTMSYNEKSIDEENLFEGFDDHEIERGEETLKVKAEKKFDKSIFEELDFVDLDDNSEEVTVRYEATFVEEESTMYLSVIIDDNNGENDIIEVLPGLVTFNKLGEADVMFMDGDEEIWLSDLQNSDVINNTGFWSFVRKVINHAI